MAAWWRIRRTGPPDRPWAVQTRADTWTRNVSTHATFAEAVTAMRALDKGTRP